MVKNSPKNSEKSKRSSLKFLFNSKVKEIQELEFQYAESWAEEKEGLKDTLTERVDGYLEYVCEEWMKENELVSLV